ncbi:helix-turn-helix domain-containing protein [Sphingomonas jatrophae]|uniref:AraC family transcriptional regulator, transcriptional activator of the genes for pyochelin and ferripyochelin receptors n=1 Tax=Sphingomonas jatrophae TaxID=1166337 RepID=A0A1I6M2D7_9SPHN|nr:AraC family transcriptional regulator [Sphingomonas jatrophae]SFS09887.1 AraC family transcriptional regulator, transcriptional activator of the genes for pyochelin and ferripyochelin receptors [Sphingomonas jatrophae]
MDKQRIEVSAEMLSFVGPGAVATDWPAGWLLLLFDGLHTPAPARAATAHLCDADELAAADLVLAVNPAACERLGGRMIDAGRRWYLPSDLRAVGLAITDCDLPEPARATLRLAKSIELFVALLTRVVADQLVGADEAGELREGDAMRILAARRLIDENWREKLTLDEIARTCGVNRAKLTRGFRLMFNCSIADALAENRLNRARHMLRETDLAISLIGYACGYQNNASFTRAFSRRFGMPPSHIRQVAA